MVESDGLYQSGEMRPWIEARQILGEVSSDEDTTLL